MDTTTANWKKKLSAGQLERKRLMDRTNRRRARLGSKQSQKDLQQQFMNLVEKEECSLLLRLVSENNQLLKIQEHCQSKIESLIHWSQDCLEFTQNPSLSFKATCSRDEDSSPSPESRPSIQELTGDLVSSIACRDSLSSSVLLPNYPVTRPQPSIISQISSTLREQQLNLNPARSSSDFIESVITWKIANSESLGSECLIAHLGLDDAPNHMNTSKVWSAICVPNFYGFLHRALYHNEQIPHAGPGDKALDNLSSMPTLVKERRSIYYLSYVHLQQYRPLFLGLPEYFAAYWITYTYLTFLAFPTERNLRKCPVWLWPTHGQFQNQHPGNIDFYAWPMLRERLTREGVKHDVRSLTHFLVENWVLSEFPGKLGSTQITLKPDLSGLELTPTFHQGILDLQNYKIKETFRQRYPELSEFFGVSDVCWPQAPEQLIGSVSEDDSSQDTANGFADGNAHLASPTFLLGDEGRNQSAILDMMVPWTDLSPQLPDLCDFGLDDGVLNDLCYGLVSYDKTS